MYMSMTSTLGCDEVVTCDIDKTEGHEPQVWVLLCFWAALLDAQRTNREPSKYSLALLQLELLCAVRLRLRPCRTAHTTNDLSFACAAPCEKLPIVHSWEISSFFLESQAWRKSSLSQPEASV